MVRQRCVRETRQSEGDDVANAECERLERLSEQSSTIGEQDERLCSISNESSRGQQQEQMWPTPRARLIGMTMTLSQGMANLRHKK